MVQGVGDINGLAIENQDLAEILYQTYEDPESLKGSSLDRVQHLLVVSYSHFQRVHLAHQSGLISNELYEVQKAGFGFSSDVGLDLIDTMQGSSMGESLWDVVRVSAEQAKAYCLNPQNTCVAGTKQIDLITVSILLSITSNMYIQMNLRQKNMDKVINYIRSVQKT